MTDKTENMAADTTGADTTAADTTAAAKTPDASDVPPDRLSVNPRNEHFDQEVLQRGGGRPARPWIARAIPSPSS